MLIGYMYYILDTKNLINELSYLVFSFSNSVKPLNTQEQKSIKVLVFK